MKTLSSRTSAQGVLLIAISALFIALTLGITCSPHEAYAAEMAHLTSNGRIPYAGYFTTRFECDGEIAYCGNPSATAPPSGLYEKRELSASSGRTQETAADLWFGYGSPGFDASLWPSTWYDGSPMDNDRYAALTHILLSDTFSSNGHYALYGTDGTFAEWCRQNVIGYGTSGERLNENATGIRIFNRMGEVPSNFHAFMLYTGSGNQLILSFTYVPFGTLDLQKASADPLISDGNDCYKYEGAVFGIYDDAGARNQVATMTTDSSGYAKSGDLAPGSYWVKEVTPPPGYALDPTVYPVTVVGEQTVRVAGDKVYDMPQGDPIEMLLSKHDGDRVWSQEENKAQGAATLALAQYKVDYYDGYYDTAAAAQASGYPTRSWVFQTDGDGYVNLALGESTFEYEGQSYPYKVSGDQFYKSQSGNITVPLGTLVIQETKPPEGYLLIDPTTDAAPAAVAIKITSDQVSIPEVHTFNMPKFPEKVIRGGLEVVKNDAETKTATPQGDATLAGCKIEITNLNEESVIVEGHEYAPGAVCATITTDEQGVAKSAADLLPIGHYSWKEVEAPQGYNLTDGEPREFDIEVDGDIVTFEGDENLFDEVIRGGVALTKHDAETKRAEPQGQATLAGVIFEIKSLCAHDVIVDGKTYSNGQVVKTIETDEQGRATTAADTLPYGRYSITEVKASTGYLLTDGTPREFSITTEGVIVEIDPSTAFYNRVIRGGVSIVKHDAETRLTVPQGDATLAGTVFEIKSLNPDHTVLVDGVEYSYGDVVKTITTDEAGAASTSNQLLPYGHYSITEVTPSTGYLLTDSEPREFDIREEGVIVAIDPDEAFYNRVIRGGVEVQKRDLESDLPYPLGGATLAGTTFEITNNSKRSVRVDGIDYEPGEVCKTILSGEDGKAATSSDALPYGSYSIKEVAPSEGYLLTDEEIRTFQIREEGVIVTFEAAKDWRNQVKRGDLEFVKVGESDMERLANVPFALISQTTGERHVIVCDENGYANTHSSWNPHTQRTNANDEATEETYDEEAGLWFGLTHEGWMVDVQDELGALPYDYYTLQELPCTSNAGYELLTVKNIRVKRHDVIVQLGTLDDPLGLPPDIETTARDGFDADKIVFGDTEATITDTVAYSNLAPGVTYHLEGTLMDAETGEPFLVGEEEVTASVDFTPEAADGTVDVNFTFDATAVKDNLQLTVFERLYTGDELVAEHTELNDGTQTVTIIPPKIGTTAFAEDKSSKTVIGNETCVIVDTVRYANLLPGAHYKLTATLYSAAERAPVNLYIDPLTAETEFTPEAPEGEVDVTFTFDATMLKEGSFVVAEVLTRDGARITDHVDVDDAGQTVEVVKPTIGTTATDAVDGDKQVSGDALASVTDVVAYENLTPGETYTVTGTLYVKSTGEPLLQDGEPVTASVEFSPDAPTGTVELTFTFDASLLWGEEIVAFENVAKDGIEVAVHADIEDEGQTVEVVEPKIGTTATDAFDGDKELATDPEVTLQDIVAYENLIVGKTYTMMGTLHLKSTGEPLLVDDEPLTSSVEFTPAEPTGEVALEFTFDSVTIADDDVVVFEELTRDEVTVATHADIDDEGQTVHVLKPEIGTTATDASDGDKELEPSMEVTIKDVVAYHGLFPGKEYTVRGVLMDKETGEPLLINDEPVIAEATFTPEAPDGEVELTFTFDATGLAGKEIVVFETLYRDDREIAVHADIDDEAQTVTMKELPPEEGTPFDKTGAAGLWPLWVAIGAGIVAGAAIIIRTLWRRRLAASADEGEATE